MQSLKKFISDDEYITLQLVPLAGMIQVYNGCYKKVAIRFTVDDVRKYLNGEALGFITGYCHNVSSKEKLISLNSGSHYITITHSQFKWALDTYDAITPEEMQEYETVSQQRTA